MKTMPPEITASLVKFRSVDCGVVVSGVSIYCEDSDWYNDGISAEDVAKDLAKCLGVKLTRLRVGFKPAKSVHIVVDENEWDWSEVADKVAALLAKGSQ